MRTKYCEYIIEEGEQQGQKCNIPFQVNFSPTMMHKKYCAEHDSAILESGLSRSRNLHAVQGNREAMRDWVKERMSLQPRKDAELSEAIASITRIKLLLEETQHQDESRICNLIDQNLMKILNSLGILNDDDELAFATVRNLLTIQGQLRYANTQIEELNERITTLENI